MRGPVIDAPPGDDTLALAAFYERLLGWRIAQSAPGGWAMLESPEGLKIEIQGLAELSGAELAQRRRASSR